MPDRPGRMSLTVDTRDAASRSAGRVTTYRRSVRPGGDPTVIAMRLALGRDIDVSSTVDWVAVLAVALRERLGGLAWLRSGTVIRSAAPADVVDRWRTLAVVIDQRGRERLGALRAACTTLAAAGCRPIVLKGMALSQRLYGDPYVRASDDIDLFVATGDRARATNALRASGWRLVEGSAPWDELFELEGAPRVYLEIHESLVTDYLAHVRLPDPAAELVDLGEYEVHGLSGASEPAYLAAHLAGHQLTPLLWGIDFLTLWSRLRGDEQAAARRVATDVGLERYLDWAVAFGATVAAAADGDGAALARLGVRGTHRSDAHVSAWRHARLASNAMHAARAVGACLWPRPIRWNVGALVKRFTWSARYRGVERDSSLQAREADVRRVAGGAIVEDPRQGFRLDGTGALEVIREAISVAGSARVRAAGTSMWPTLRKGSVVVVVALPEQLRRGQIVLMDWGGMPVLHRIVNVSGTEVRTAGDACLDPDPPTPIAKVRALAVSLVDDRGVIPLVPSMTHGFRPWLLYVGARTRLWMARAWRRRGRLARFITGAVPGRSAPRARVDR